jgi:hypothetical protein
MSLKDPAVAAPGTIADDPLDRPPRVRGDLESPFPVSVVSGSGQCAVVHAPVKVKGAHRVCRVNRRSCMWVGRCAVLLWK